MSAHVLPARSRTPAAADSAARTETSESAARRGTPTGPTTAIPTSGNERSAESRITIPSSPARNANGNEEDSQQEKKNEKPSCSPSVRDRKSTRLNSSHLGISYAVFCLKNKREA